MTEVLVNRFLAFWLRSCVEVLSHELTCCVSLGKSLLFVETQGFLVFFLICEMKGGRSEQVLKLLLLPSLLLSRYGLKNAGKFLIDSTKGYMYFFNPLNEAQLYLFSCLKFTAVS
jgi:hypothetical protein